MFYENWESLLRVAIMAICAYVAMVVLLRVSGNRTLSKMSAFDFVVTVALGSSLATVILSNDVTLAMGVTAFAVLISLQFIVTWLSVRIPALRRIVTGEPMLLLYRGQFLERSLRRTRVAREEVHAALRQQGLRSLDDAEAVILETDGSITVVHQGQTSGESTLKHVRRVNGEAHDDATKE